MRALQAPQISTPYRSACRTSHADGKTDADKLIEITAALEPTFGGINLRISPPFGLLQGRDRPEAADIGLP